MKVRLANSNDANQIERLYKILVPNDNSISVLPERIIEISKSINNYLYVVEKDNNIIIGTAFLTFCLDPMYKFAPYAVIENIIIDDNHRGNGIGRMLMLEIENNCRNNKCTKIMILSSSKRKAAHDFFTAVGFDKNAKIGFVKYLNKISAQQVDAPEPATMISPASQHHIGRPGDL
ncbi:hypothetical protein LBMAG53_22010 [Planctomycetota bacterium]|nr:hypothetical protein LBMAG53_22010 [Planctomycetota bacterium]